MSCRPNLFGETAIGSEISKPDPDHEDFCAYGTHLECRGAVSCNGKLIALRNLPGGRNANAFGINDFGELVGFAENGVRDSKCATNTPFQTYRFEAVKWDSEGEIQELASLTMKGDTVVYAMGMNDLGQAVGSSGTCETEGLPPFHVTGRHAVLWEREGTPVYLGTLGDAKHTGSNNASSVNDLEEVVGTQRRHSPLIPVDKSSGHARPGASSWCVRDHCRLLQNDQQPRRSGRLRNRWQGIARRGMDSTEDQGP